MELIRFLISSCQIKNWSRPPPHSRDGISLVNIQNPEVDKLLSKGFLSKAIQLTINKPALVDILAILLWENEAKSEFVLKLMLEIIEETNRNDLKTPFEIVANILLLDDGLMFKRTKLWMAQFIDWLAKVKDNPEKVAHAKQCFNFMDQIKNLERSKEIQKWVKKNEAKWREWTKWYNESP